MGMTPHGGSLGNPNPIANCIQDLVKDLKIATMMDVGFIKLELI
jgi:hypothetical protein